MSTFEPENGPRFSYNFDFQGRIYLKVENVFFARYWNFDFHGRIQLKVEKCIFIKKNTILAPALEGPRSSPGRPKSSPGSPKSSPGDPKSSPWVPKTPAGGPKSSPRRLQRPILYIQTPDQPQSGRYSLISSPIDVMGTSGGELGELGGGAPWSLNLRQQEYGQPGPLRSAQY